MRSAKILVVDDESDIRETLREILGDEGYEVEVAADPLSVAPADVFLASGGTEVLVRLRADAERARVPVLWVATDADALEEALDAGADDGVVVPWTAQELGGQGSERAVRVSTG